MKKRSILALTLVAALAVIAPAQAFAKDENGFPNTNLTGVETGIEPYRYEGDTPLTISLLFSDHEGYPLKQDAMLFTELEEITNVHLDITLVPRVGYEQKRDLLIAAGEAPDIIGKVYQPDEAKFVASGVLLPISQYMENLPFLSEKIERWGLEKDFDDMRRSDNEVYAIAGFNEVVNVDYSLGVRVDILEANDIPEPDSWDEVYDMLAALKEIYPDAVLYTEGNEFGGSFSLAANVFEVGAGWSLANASSLVRHDPESDEFYFWAETEDFKEFLTYFNKLVSDGLLDPESFTQTTEMAEQKLVNDKAFVTVANGQNIITLNDKLIEAEKEGTFARINVPAGPRGGWVQGSRNENGVLIMRKTTKYPYFEDLLRFVDYVWHSDEMQLFTIWGIQGETFEIVDGAVQPLLPYELKAYGFGMEGATEDLRIDHAFSGGMFNYGGAKELRNTLANAETAAFRLKAATREVRPAGPTFANGFDPMDTEQFNLIGSPLTDYIKEMTVKFILGTENLESGWDDFQTQLKAKNSEKLTELANLGYQRTK